LAGLPAPVIARAREILALLEGEQLVRGGRLERGAAPARVVPPEDAPREQLGLFGANHPLLEKLATIDVNRMTPLEALTTLASLAAEAKGNR